MSGSTTKMNSGAQSDRVDILMATYNGAAYIGEQIESLLRQTHRGWSLIVRDDGSQDDTVSIVRNYAEQHRGRIRLIQTASGALGPAGSFSVLLEASQANYVMFCDQDDVWLPTKVELSLATLQQQETMFGPSTPLLVHTDLAVVNHRMHTLADSYWNYQNLDPEAGCRLNRLLAQNVVTGCSVMMNRSLVDLATPIPAQAVMHDWWCALVAAAFGGIVHITTPSILYRQHLGNSIGAARWGPTTAWKMFRSSLVSPDIRTSLQRCQQQAKAFWDGHGDRLTEEQARTVHLFAHLNQVWWLRRKWLVVRHGFRKTGFIKSAGMWLWI